MTFFRVSLAVLILALVGVPAVAEPKIGDKAPAVKVAEWMTKPPPALPGEKEAEKYVFVVEFWATWCKPCWKSIPHLGELHKKHEKDGLVIIGISNEEPEVITEFIGSEKLGKKMEMPYFIGRDEDIETTTAWTTDVPGIPYAFVVNKDGVVVWQGNPLAVETFDAVIEKVLAGKYDLEAAKKAADAEKKYDGLKSELQAAFATRDQKKLFKILDEMIELKPFELQPYLIKRSMLFEFKKEDQVEAWAARIIEQFKDAPDSLRQIVQVELSKEIAQRDPALLVRCASRLAAAKDPSAETLDTLARVQCECGRLEEAIETQTRAVAAASKEARAEYEKTLDYYKKVKQLAKELGGVPTTSKAE